MHFYLFCTIVFNLIINHFDINEQQQKMKKLEDLIFNTLKNIQFCI